MIHQLYGLLFHFVNSHPSLAALRYGASADDLTLGEVKSTYSSYYATYDHHAVLEFLEPSTEYFYQIISPDDETVASDVFSFRTAPLSGDGDGTKVIFAVFGDLGLVNGDSTRKYLTEQVCAPLPCREAARYKVVNSKLLPRSS